MTSLVALTYQPSPSRDAMRALISGGRIAGPPTAYGFTLDTRDLTPFGRATLGAAQDAARPSARVRSLRLSSPTLPFGVAPVEAGPATYVAAHCPGTPATANCGDTVRHSPHIWYDCR